MAKELKINIPFTVRWMNDTSGCFAYVEHPNMDGVSGYYGTESALKKSMRPMIEQAIREALLAVKYQDETVFVWCVDGTLLLVAFRNGGWGYSIFDPRRGNCGGCIGGGTTKEEIIHRAKQHAEQSYGGFLSVHGYHGLGHGQSPGKKEEERTHLSKTRGGVACGSTRDDLRTTSDINFTDCPKCIEEHETVSP